MKSTDSFKQAVSEGLTKMGTADPLFAESLKKANKNIEDCITHILNSVQKSGCNGFTDDEIFGIAAHYYDEDNLVSGKPVNCKVVVNHGVELTAEEIAGLKKKAMDEALLKERNRITKPSAVKTAMSAKSVAQGSLF